MAYFRRYAEFPLMFVPDVGEVVWASPCKAGPFHRAVVTSVKRASQGTIRVDWVYLDNTPGGPQAGEKGNTRIHKDDGAPRIRRLPVNPSPKGEGSQTT